MSKIKEIWKNLWKGKKWPKIKLLIGLAIVVGGLVFVTINAPICYNDHNTKKLPDPLEVKNPLKANSVFSQSFTARNGKLTEIGVYFDNQGNAASKGSITAEIKDPKGKVVAKTKLKSKEIRNRHFTRFIFENPPEMVGGDSYRMVFKCKNFKNPQGFGIYTSSVKSKYMMSSATIDGITNTEYYSHIRATMTYRFYDYSLLKKMIALLVFAIIFILIPFGKIEDFVEKKWRKIHIDRFLSRAIFVATPLIAYVIVEVLSGYTTHEVLLKAFTIKGFFNMLIYAAIMIVAYAVCNRVQYASIFTWILGFVFGLSNYFVSEFRGIPVLATDLLSLNTAANVAGEFEYTIDIWVLLSATILVAAVGITFSLKPNKGFKLKQRIIPVAFAIVAIIFVYSFFISVERMPNFKIWNDQWKPQRKYTKNGTALSFTCSWRYIRKPKPEGYSVDDVKEITKGFESDKVKPNDATTKKMPNIIAIMNESLADFSVDGELDTTEDYLPFIRSMKKNTIKGQLFVSIVGANTANSEFEFLTGFSMSLFSARSVPYNNYVKGVVPSMTRSMKVQGYQGNNAYHPYRRSGWNRKNVYNSLGFNNFYSDEYYKKQKGIKYIRNFISDESDFNQIIRDFNKAKAESGAPFYLFNVTVQNHGGYLGNMGFVDTDVKVTTPGINTDENNQYVSLAKKSDEAFEKLIKHFEKEKEPTIIVMFGDHQPPLSWNFYSKIFGKSTNYLSAEENAYYYSTPYVIWANYDIKEKQHEDMSCNYLSSYLMKLAGADMTGYNKYLLDLKKKLPVLTGVGYKGDNGVFYTMEDKTEYTKTIEDYKKVQYNGLFDKDNRLNDFFFLNKADYELEPYEDPVEETTTAKN
ncbi:MAG: sulfatase-like hydrolase/transferase [Eubacterium sp.]|nr:sulfatase-like hydrolase/transferase [Eubacterium sp.]